MKTTFLCITLVIGQGIVNQILSTEAKINDAYEFKY